MSQELTLAIHDGFSKATYPASHVPASGPKEVPRSAVAPHAATFGRGQAGSTAIDQGAAARASGERKREHHCPDPP